MVRVDPQLAIVGAAALVVFAKILLRLPGPGRDRIDLLSARGDGAAPTAVNMRTWLASKLVERRCNGNL